MARTDPLLSIGDLAEWLGVSVPSLYGWRSQGRGPSGFRVGGLVKYRVSDVEAWLELQRDEPRARVGA